MLSRKDSKNKELNLLNMYNVFILNCKRCLNSMENLLTIEKFFIKKNIVV